MDGKEKIILAICEYSGNTVLDYIEAGYHVIMVDLKHKTMQIENVTLIGEPVFWLLENPVGRLATLRPERLGKPVMYFNPCDYGDNYTKKTCLWGDFIPPLPLFIGEDRSVEPEKVCSQGSWLMKLGGSSERTKELRSMTPRGYARAFFEMNK